MASVSAVGRRVAILAAAALCVALIVHTNEAHPGEAPGPEPGPAVRRAPQGRGSATRRPPRQHRFSRPQVMNVIDEALYELAQHYAASDRLPDAVRILEEVAAETPDAETRSTTYFNLGVIYQEKLAEEAGAAAKARAYFSKVTGRMAGTARNRILAPLRRQRDWAEAVGFLKECLENTGAAADRADVVRQLVQIARSCGDTALMESVLSSVPDMIAYEDAQKDAESRRAKMEEARRARAEEIRRAQAAQSPGYHPDSRGRRPDRAERSREATMRRDRRRPVTPESPWRARERRRPLEPPPPVGRGRAAEEPGGDESTGEESADNEPDPPQP